MILSGKKIKCPGHENRLNMVSSLQGSVQNQAMRRSGFAGVFFNFSSPRDLKIIVFPLGTASFPEITSPISPETIAFFLVKKI